MESREQRWKQSRCGHVTSSGLSQLFTGGREYLSAQERALAPKGRITKDVEFGEVAKSYIWSIVHEVKRGKPTFSRGTYNFDKGHEQEPMAVKWLRANTLYDVQSCTSDFDDIVFNVAACGLGDSPDFYVGSSGIGEIKCPVSEAKFEELLEMSREEAVQEYRLQMAGHLLAAPWADKLYYLIYSGQNDDDPFDLLSPLALDRGVLHAYDRSEFEDDFERIRKKVEWVTLFVHLAAKGGPRVRDINDYWQYCTVEELRELLGSTPVFYEKTVRPR